MLHWDGSGWTSMAATTFTMRLTNVWGASASSVWAVGYQLSIFSWSGSQWRGSYFDPQSFEALVAIWGSGPNDIWAAGHSENRLHWDGNTWGAVRGSSWVEAAWGRAADDVWMVGKSGVAEHWNGSTWSTSPLLDVDFYGVWGTSGGEVWIVGGDHLDTQSIIYHYVGSTRSSSVGPGSRNLLGIWGSSDHDIWAVGRGGTLLHYQR
jgi:hypothetical protein